MKYTILLIICLLLSGCTPIIPEPIEPIPCAELAQLKVIYNGRYLISGEVIEIPNNTKVLFEVQGFDITGTLDACIDGSQISWGAGCPCTHWDTPVGVTNMVWTDNYMLNIKRSVWVEHSSGISFRWRVEVIK